MNLISLRLAAILGIMLLGASQAVAQKANQAEKGERRTTKAAGGENQDPLEVRFQRVMAQLAKIELQKAQESNKQVAGTIPANEVERLEHTYRLAQLRFEQAQKSGGDPRADRLREAEANAQIFEENLSKAIAANRLAANSVPALAVERLRLIAEMGRLKLEREKETDESNAGLGELQQEVKQLRKELATLKDRLDQLSPETKTSRTK
jgi:hypothetical protein